MGAIQNIVNELRRRGVVVNEWSGWQNRGNGGVKDLDVKGIILHHTGSGYGSAYPELVSSSQPWASGGALCNFSGNADGSLTVIAAGLAYHAGGGYGPNQGPLAPYANNRNYYTVGLEIIYPGSQPMTSQQYETAVALSRVVVDLYAGGNAEYVRAHAEVNGQGYEGKWDPGSGVGTQYINMTDFRNAVRNWSEDVALTSDDINAIVNAVYGREIQLKQLAGGVVKVSLQGALEYLDYRAQSTDDKVGKVEELVKDLKDSGIPYTIDYARVGQASLDALRAELND